MSRSAPNSEPLVPESSRRRFLKRAAAFGAAVVAGAGQRAAHAETQKPAPDDPTKELGEPVRPYGERSRFETCGPQLLYLLAVSALARRLPVQKECAMKRRWTIGLPAGIIAQNYNPCLRGTSWL
jgi:hypothetical protein